MGFARFRVLTFSCYGTLIDRDSGIWGALRPLLARGQLELPRAAVLEAFAAAEARERQEGGGARPYEDLLAAVHHRLAAGWGLAASEADHELFARSLPAWPPFAEVPAALQYLRRFFRLALLSNADPASLAASQRRLEVRFDHVYSALELGAYKPDAAVFEAVARRLEYRGVARDQVLHAASSLEGDNLPAKRCGLAAAWIDRNDLAAAGLDPREDSVDFRFRHLLDMVRAHQTHLRL